MGKQRLLGLFVISIVVGLVAWEVFCPHEPMYEGKPLSDWLEGYAPRVRTETSIQLSDHAMQGIGTNAIPYLLAMLREKDSPMKLRLNAWLKKQHVISYRFKFLTSFDRAIAAGSGLQALRSDARSAVPDLVQLMQTNYPNETRWAAASTLGTIGPSASNAVPALVASLANKADSMRSYAIGALGKLHCAPQICVPALTRCLNDKAYFDRVWAAQALTCFGPDAKTAVPTLIDAGRTREPELHDACLNALKQIDPEAAGRFQSEAAQPFSH